MRKVYSPQVYNNSTIFKTINEGTNDVKTVTFLQARKIAEQELNAELAKQATILEADKIALYNYEQACIHGSVSVERCTIFSGSFNNMLSNTKSWIGNFYRTSKDVLFLYKI